MADLPLELRWQAMTKTSLPRTNTALQRLRLSLKEYDCGLTLPGCATDGFSVLFLHLVAVVASRTGAAARLRTLSSRFMLPQPGFPTCRAAVRVSLRVNGDA